MFSIPPAYRELRAYLELAMEYGPTEAIRDAAYDAQEWWEAEAWEHLGRLPDCYCDEVEPVDGIVTMLGTVA